MPVKSLSSLLTHYPHDEKLTQISITGMTTDSRQVQPGDLFIACYGTHLNGQDFIRAAIQNGAAAVLLEGEQAVRFEGNTPLVSLPDFAHNLGSFIAEFYDHPVRSLKMYGVTGTNGKTSSSHFTATALSALNCKTAMIGTLGAGLYGQLEPTGWTTPDALTMQQCLAKFVKQGVQAVAIEVSSHSLVQGRVAGIPFETATFTNLTRDHLDYHGSMDAYGNAKKSFFTDYPLQHAIVNVDDAYGREIIAATPHPVIAYSMTMQQYQDHAMVSASDIQLGLKGFQAKIKTPWGVGVLRSRLIGHFNVSNILGVLSVLGSQGYPLKDILEVLETVEPVSGRMQAFGGGDKPLVVVDYAHTPDALQNALQALRAHCEGELWCLFGCGGDRDKGKRPLMAEMAEKYADQVMVTDDNPRHEEGKDIATDIFKGFSDPKRVRMQLDRAKAIQDIIQCAKPGDAILIAGRGGETHQIIGANKIPFNDAEKVSTLLSEYA